MTKPIPNGMTCWPRYDPRVGLWLCEGCWNKGSWSHHCPQGACGCIKRGCGGFQQPVARQRFTRESLKAAGQTSILDLDLGRPLQISPKS